MCAFRRTLVDHWYQSLKNSLYGFHEEKQTDYVSGLSDTVERNINDQLLATVSRPISCIKDDLCETIYFIWRNSIDFALEELLQFSSGNRGFNVCPATLLENKLVLHKNDLRRIKRVRPIPQFYLMFSMLYNINKQSFTCFRIAPLCAHLYKVSTDKFKITVAVCDLIYMLKIFLENDHFLPIAINLLLGAEKGMAIFNENDISTVKSLFPLLEHCFACVKSEDLGQAWQQELGLFLGLFLDYHEESYRIVTHPSEPAGDFWFNETLKDLHGVTYVVAACLLFMACFGLFVGLVAPFAMILMLIYRGA